MPAGEERNRYYLRKWGGKEAIARDHVGIEKVLSQYTQSIHRIPPFWELLDITLSASRSSVEPNPSLSSAYILENHVS
jgi:hypothetical protein